MLVMEERLCPLVIVLFLAVSGGKLHAADYVNPFLPTPPGDTQWGADPYVVDGRDGYYYLYFTKGLNSARLRSSDLVTWTSNATMLIGQAPHVYYDDATATWNLFGNLQFHQSDSPTSTGNVATLNGYDLGANGFDPYQYTDPIDNQSYLFNGGYEHRHAINLLSSPTQSIQTIYPHFMDGWWGAIWEGPTILKHGDTYYWFISMNGADTRYYRLAYATAPSPKGPWEMQTWDNAACFARSSDGEAIYGPGHPGIIQDTNGTWWMYYQQKDNTTTDWERKIALDPFWFDSSGVPHIRLTRGLTRPGPGSPVTTIWPVVPASNTLIQAETFSGSAIGDLGVGLTNLVNLKSRAYLAYRHLDFGPGGVNGIAITLRNELNQAGSIEVHTGGVNGPLVGVVPFTYISTAYRTISVALNQTLTGIHDIVLVVQGARPEVSIVRIDSFQFLATAPANASPVPPAVSNDVVYVPLGIPVTFRPLDNDSAGGSGTLGISGIRTNGHAGAANGGRAVLNADNSITYTPATNNYWGEDRITYAASSGAGAFREGEVILRIHPGTHVHPDVSGTAVIEAESYNQLTGTDTSPWTLASVLSGAAGGSYVVTPDNGSSAGSSRLDYALDVRTPGLYKVWLRCSQPNTSGNTLLFTLSARGSTLNTFFDSFSTTVDNGTRTSNSWYWVSLPQLRALRSGLHRISIQRGKDGLALDRILLTTDPDYDPAADNTGLGPLHATRLPSDGGAYSTWAVGRAWPSVPSESSLPGADPNADGVANLLAYALDLDPLGPAAALAGLAAPTLDRVMPNGPWFTFTYRRNTGATDLGYSVQYSDDLTAWDELLVDNTTTFAEIAVADPDGDGTSVLERIRTRIDPEASSARFLRLRITQP